MAVETVLSQYYSWWNVLLDLENIPLAKWLVRMPCDLGVLESARIMGSQDKQSPHNSHLHKSVQCRCAVGGREKPKKGLNLLRRQRTPQEFLLHLPQRTGTTCYTPIANLVLFLVLCTLCGIAMGEFFRIMFFILFFTVKVKDNDWKT